MQQNEKYGITDVARDLITGKAEYVSTEVAEQRMNVCRKCDHFIKMMTICNQCGCYMPAKTKFKLAHCPKDKW